ncbi:MAG: hypothetical protein ACRCXZ_00235 [Patescibacteria group bacterium]
MKRISRKLDRISKRISQKQRRLILRCIDSFGIICLLVVLFTFSKVLFYNEWFSKHEVISPEVNCVSHKECKDLSNYFAQFQKETGVKIQFRSTNANNEVVQKVQTGTTSWLKKDSKRAKSWIKTFRRIYPDKLNSISIYSDIKDAGGYYSDKERNISLQNQDVSRVLLHEIGHAFTPLVDDARTINALEYYFGKNLEQMKLTTDPRMVVQGLKEYTLNIQRVSLEDKPTFVKLLDIQPEMRLSYLRSFSKPLWEISSVPMELFESNLSDSELNPALIWIVKLKQLVLLSRGNEVFLSDRFLAIMEPLLNPSEDFDEVAFDKQMQTYLQNPGEQTISSRLRPFYDDAMRLGLY